MNTISKVFLAVGVTVLFGFIFHSSMAMRDLYRYLALVFHVVQVFAIFFILAGFFKQSGCKWWLLVSFGVVFVLGQEPVSTLFGAITGFAIGYFLQIYGDKYQAVANVGLGAMFIDVFWPSNVANFMDVVATRSSLLNFGIGLFGDFSIKAYSAVSTFHNGNIIARDATYLFGIHPITVSLSHGLFRQTVFHVFVSIVAFLILYFVAKMYYEMRCPMEGEERGLITALTIYGFALLPIYSLINIILIVFGLVIGYKAVKADFLTGYLFKLDATKALIIVTSCLVFYQLSFVIAFGDALSLAGYIFQEILYTSTAMLAIIIGMIVAKTREGFEY